MSLFKRNSNDPIKQRQEELAELIQPKRARLAAGGQLKQVAKLMDADEQGIAVFSGVDADAPAVFVATDRRVLYVAGAVGSYRRHSLPYGQLTEVFTSNETMLGSSVSVRAGSEAYEVRRSAGDAEAFARVVRGRIGQGSVSQAVSSGAGELSRLVELYQQGLLSDEEFAAAKARALGL